jgi:hypothetical protein
LAIKEYGKVGDSDEVRLKKFNEAVKSVDDTNFKIWFYFKLAFYALLVLAIISDILRIIYMIRDRKQNSLAYLDIGINSVLVSLMLIGLFKLKRLLSKNPKMIISETKIYIVAFACVGMLAFIRDNDNVVNHIWIITGTNLLTVINQIYLLLFCWFLISKQLNTAIEPR